MQPLPWTEEARAENGDFSELHVSHKPVTFYPEYACVSRSHKEKGVQVKHTCSRSPALSVPQLLIKCPLRQEARKAKVTYPRMLNMTLTFVFSSY